MPSAEEKIASRGQSSFYWTCSWESQTNMQSFLIAGGTGGIGHQAARVILAGGHRVVIVGRVQRDEVSLRASLRSERVRFLRADLSTHDGVREAAKRLLAENDRFDAVLHTTGVFTTRDVRTSDGLHVMFAVNYLSRYHLTQLLLPLLRRAERPRVVMLTADVPVSTALDLRLFPKFEPFDLWPMTKQIQIANHHYAAHLARNEPTILAGVINAGSAKTGIMRMMPWYWRAFAAAFGPLMPLLFNTVEESASNPVEASLRNDWASPVYWGKPGAFDQRTPIVLDNAVTDRVIEASRELTRA